MTGGEIPYTAVVLAADRAPGEAVALATGALCKSLAPVGGIPMVLRVLDALDTADEVESCVLCGPSRAVVERAEELSARITSGKVSWMENEATPSSSTYHVLQSLPETTPVLVTTADHALLSPQMVDYFCSEARKTGCDVVAALASHRLVAEAYPETRRTVTRLRDGAYCGCNLFAFLTPRARLAAHFWRRVDKQRKKTLRVVSVLGWIAVLRYILGQLTLNEALERLSRRLGLSAGFVDMPFPEAAVDVDTVDDWRLVDSIFARRNT